MVFTKTSLFFVMSFLTFINLTSYGQELKLHKLKTKQAIENIRFINDSGFFTYFQNNSGKLFLSKNFANKIVFKDDPQTQYNLLASPAKKKIIVTKDKTFYAYLSLTKNLDILVLNYGTKDAQYIAQGISPKLHLDDQWISYFIPNKRQLIFQEINNDKKSYKVQLQASPTSYHIPQVEMISETQFIYTDLNNENQSKLIAYYPQTKQQDIIFQSQQTTAKIELCRIDDFIVFAQTSKVDQDFSSILAINTQDSPTLKKFFTLYNQPSKNLGHLLCLKDELYFLKQRKDQGEYYLASQDLYSFSTEAIRKTQPPIKRTNDITIEHLFSLDGRLMTILSGEFYELAPASHSKQESSNTDKGIL